MRAVERLQASPPCECATELLSRVQEAAPPPFGGWPFPRDLVRVLAGWFEERGLSVDVKVPGHG